MTTEETQTIDTLESSFADGFSHKEMLAITGITTVRLMSWYKRHSLPSGFPDAPGRGNRRRYSKYSVRALLAMRALADAGLPLEDASALAVKFGIQIGTILLAVSWRPLKDAVKEITFHPESHFMTTGAWPDEIAMILQKPTWWTRKTWEDMGVIPELAYESPGFVALTNSANDTLREFREWMRAKIGVRAITIFDVHALVLDYLVGLKKAQEARH